MRETLLKHVQMVTELIARDRNHPSVVMWSVANEPDSEYAHAALNPSLNPNPNPNTNPNSNMNPNPNSNPNPNLSSNLNPNPNMSPNPNPTRHANAAAYFKHLFQHTRTLDPSRPITFASFKSPAKDQVAQYADVLLVNRYYAWYTDTGQTDIIPHALERDMLVWRRVARPNPHLHPNPRP